MKRLFIILTAAVMIFPGCRTQNKTTSADTGLTRIIDIEYGDNSSATLDWSGTYEGILPCADCGGIITTIVLNEDLTYSRTMLYKGKGGNPFTDSGKFSWDKQGRSILLEGANSGNDRFLVGENMLAMLDRDGNRITGELADKYILSKKTTGLSGDHLSGKTWKLIELNGHPVSVETEGGNGIFMIFDPAGQRIHGFGGCNQYSGSYELTEGNRVSFEGILATRLACPELSTEQAFFDALQQADAYAANEERLQLNQGRGLRLAVFERMNP